MIFAQTGIEFINYGLKLENLPKSFKIGDFDIAYYGVIIACGILAGIMVACLEAARTSQDSDLYIDLAIIEVIICVMGARLYYVIFKWDYYSQNLSEIINLRNGGLAIYGAVIMGIIGCVIFGKIKRCSIGLLADTAVHGLIVGQIIGRWGNFFNREAFGDVVSDSYPYAMRIYFDEWYKVSQVPDAVRKGMEDMLGKGLEEIGYVQVQPTFLYESLWNIVVLIAILVFKRYKRFDGELLMIYFIGYGMGRFFIEGMRTDQLIMPYTGWPVSQALSAALIVVGILVIVIGRMFLNKKEQRYRKRIPKA